MAADVGKSGGNGKGSRGMRVSARSCQSIPVLNKIRAEAQRSLRRFFTRSRGAAERLVRPDRPVRSEEHTSELQSLLRISYAVFCLKKKNTNKQNSTHTVQKSPIDRNLSNTLVM